MERKLKAALVGVGSMGRGHLDNYVKFLKEDSPIQIVALCDVDEKKFTNYKADFNLGEVGADGYDFNMFRLYNDLDKMLEAETDLDMVTIALPTYLHCWGACKCMEKGINVLSEKPMALTVEQCEEMIACAKKNNVRLMIGQCLRFAPAYLKLKEIIDREELNVDIQVDGGINDSTMETAMRAGANLLVAGSYVFNGDLESNVQRIQQKMQDISEKLN